MIVAVGVEENANIIYTNHAIYISGMEKRLRPAKLWVHTATKLLDGTENIKTQGVIFSLDNHDDITTSTTRLQYGQPRDETISDGIFLLT